MPSIHQKKYCLVSNSDSCEFIWLLSSQLLVFLAIHTYFVTYYHDELNFFWSHLKHFWCLILAKSVFSYPFPYVLAVQGTWISLSLHTALFVMYFSLTRFLSSLNSADYWICTNYIPKILKWIPNIVFPQKDLPISDIKDLGGKLVSLT